MVVEGGQEEGRGSMVLCVYSGCGVQRSTWCSRVGRCVFRSWPQFVCVDVKSRVVYSGMRHMGYRDPVAVVLRCLTMYHACLTHRGASLSLSLSLPLSLKFYVHLSIPQFNVSPSLTLEFLDRLVKVFKVRSLKTLATLRGS